MSLTDENVTENELKELDSNAFQKIHEKVGKIGYADGIASGSDKMFQLGFDKGYADGLYAGFHLEKYRAFFESISNSKTSPQELRKESTIYGSIALTEAAKSEHFQYKQHESKPTEEITKQQKLYVGKQLQEFEEKLPKTNNLFSLKN